MNEYCRLEHNCTKTYMVSNLLKFSVFQEYSQSGIPYLAVYCTLVLLIWLLILCTLGNDTFLAYLNRPASRTTAKFLSLLMMLNLTILQIPVFFVLARTLVSGDMSSKQHVLISSVSALTLIVHLPFTIINLFIHADRTWV